jgi:hypothetical protein
VAGTAHADPEPWSDPGSASTPISTRLGPIDATIGAEYRAQYLRIEPIALNSVTDRRASWFDHRLRLDGSLAHRDLVKVVVSIDALDGVLWGDNGTLGTEPEPLSGANVTTRNPNTTRPCVGLPRAADDPLQPSSYGFVLCDGNEARVRKLYGEVSTPIGLFRIGRQPTQLGTGVVAADGDGRPNRFGVSKSGNYADRILFATKPLEVLKPAGKRDRTQQRGLFFITGYDRLVSDTVRFADDDLNQIIASIRLLEPEYAKDRSMELAVFNGYRWDQEHGTQVDVFGWRALTRFGRLSLGAEAVMNVGSTSEVSEAYSLVNNDPVVDQRVRQLGARAVTRFDADLWTAYLEFDYASGDGNPDVRTPLEQFYFAEDANVGLLMFEHILAFQSARAAAAGNELLRRLGATTFPADVVSSRGAFHNAIALFPQFDLRPLKSLLLRTGVLAAWAASPVVDPVRSLRLKDGKRIEDDLVNLNGGKPARFYGVEIDGRIGWTFAGHFALDLEGALFFPGEALHDENGQAARSGMFQGRTTFFF